MKRTKLAQTVLLGAASLSFIAVGAEAQKAGDLKVEPYVFESVSKEKVEAELGRLLVPENRRQPRSRLIELAFVRFKSTSPHPGSPIVYLAGGPGGSGIAAARSARFPLFLAMREVADVIALDQRGVGLSKPNLDCREPVEYPLDKAPERAGLLEAFRKASRAGAERLHKEGVDLSGYNTNESADDLDDLRKALGAKKISLWAISYGTHLSLAAIKRHERGIDRVILAGVEGLTQTIKLPSNVQKHLEHIDRLVKDDPELSRDVPDFLDLMARVFDHVERAPVAVEVTNPRTRQKTKVVINKLTLQIVTAFSLGSREAALPAWFYSMSRGDFSVAARSWVFMITSELSNLGSAMNYMMDCSSGLSAARRRQVEQEAKTTLLEDVIDLPQPYVCDAWGSPDLGEDFRREPSSKIPALFISGTFDVRTPVGNAEEVRRGFPNSEHLIIEGAVHSDPLFLSSPRIKDVMIEFMKGRKISATRIILPPLKFDPVKKIGSPDSGSRRLG
jgi:pimeloyl-ACP methyl ester carboxylesterase